MTQEQDVLNIVKLRTGVEDQDMLILSYVAEIKWRILNYCQRRDIPEDLINVWASMVIDALRVDQPDHFGDGEDVSGMNIKIGDTSVSPAAGSGKEVTATSKAAIDQIVLNYKVDLRRYRKLRW